MNKRYRDWLDAPAERAHVEYYGEHFSYDERQGVASMKNLPNCDNYFISLLDLNYAIDNIGSSLSILASPLGIIATPNNL